MNIIKNRISNKEIILFFSPIILFILSFILYGYNNTWNLVGFPVGSYLFNDARVITAASESFQNGFDPLVNNPSMPTGNVMNYPRIWQILFLFGLNQAHTILFACIAIFCYLTSSIIIYSKIDGFYLKLLFIFFIYSPAALLGIERGNNDLIIIFIITVSAIIISSSPYWATGLLIFAFFLKLYPIFTLIVISIIKKTSTRLNIIVIASMICAAYLLLTFNDILLISSGTPKGGALSYGSKVIESAMLTSSQFKSAYSIEFSSNISILLKLVLILVTVFSIGIGLYRKNTFKLDKIPLDIISLFIVGATIYCGTFIIGNNWDYRLIFLNLTFPYLILILKMKITTSIRYLSYFSLSCILFTIWNIPIFNFLKSLKNISIANYLIEEISNWILYTIFLYLLTLTIKKIICSHNSLIQIDNIKT